MSFANYFENFVILFELHVFSKLFFLFSIEKKTFYKISNGLEYDELGLVGLLACRGLCALIPIARCHLRTILIFFWLICMSLLSFHFVFTLKKDFYKIS